MTQPLWIRAVVTREGDDVVTRCCVVAGANFHPIEVRVNLPKLAATLRAMGMGPKGDVVGGFGSFLKKAVKAVTKNKVTKAVGKIVGKVVRSPIVQIANPMAAITAHTLSRAAGGKGTIKGQPGAVVNLGTAIVAPAGLSYASGAAKAALGIGLKTVMASKTAAAVAATAKNAQKTVAQGMNAAALLKAGKITPAMAKPFVQQALAVRTNVQKLAPALAKKVAFSKQVQSSIKNIAVKARAGSTEARLAAVSISAAARAQDKISAAQQAAAGGHAGFVITPQGKIRKAAKGKFVMSKSLPVLETLYRGAKVEPMKGAFTAVSGSRKRRKSPHEFYDRQTLVPSAYPALEAEVYRALVEDAYQRETIPAPPGYVGNGPAWGGYDDPADEYEGPLYPVTYPGDSVSGYPVYGQQGIRNRVSGFKTAGLIPADPRSPTPDCIGGRPHAWPTPAAGTTAAARDRARALLELARARHHAEQVLKRARTTTHSLGTKVGNMSYNLIGSHLALGPEMQDDVPAELAAVNDGMSGAELIGCALNQSVSGFPSYLFTRKGLHPTVVRRRFLAALKAMPPKMRRRALIRLKAAMYRTRVSGAIRDAQPSFGYDHGWAGVSGNCGQVAGALTP